MQVKGVPFSITLDKEGVSPSKPSSLKSRHDPKVQQRSQHGMRVTANQVTVTEKKDASGNYL